MIPVAPFGASGHHSTRVIFGAAALGGMSQTRADTTLERVASWGINHIDTAAGYGDSEVRLAPWLSMNRGRVFLATKTHARSGDGARASLERSLERMGVDSVDLVQLHNLVEPDEWDRVFAPGGAVEALAAARDEGLTGHIGVTGHGLRIARAHIRSLERFDLASVLLPINFMLMQEPGYRADVDELLALCSDRDVAVQTIKAIARGRWETNEARRFSWYEPLTDPVAIGRAVKYVLADEQLFLNTTSDARLLDHIVTAAQVEPSDTGVVAPHESALRDDIAEFGITPLFDGDQLERI